MARRIKSESLENIKRVVDTEKETNIDAVAAMKSTTAAAIADSQAHEKHVEKVMNELNKNTEGLVPEEGYTGEVKDELNKKLTLSEDLEDFEGFEDAESAPSDKKKPTKVFDNDKIDTYIDFDMFDFIYEMFTTYADDRTKPLNPLSHGYHRFGGVGRDRYNNLDIGLIKDIKRQEACDELHLDPNVTYDKDVEKKIIERSKAIEAGYAKKDAPGIASGGDYIELYATKLEEFEGAQQICDLYKFRYSIKPTYKNHRSAFSYKKDEWLKWDYVMRVYVPCASNGYPLEVMEYFGPMGYKMEDILPTVYCVGYTKQAKKIKDEQEKQIKQWNKEHEAAKKREQQAENDAQVKEIVQKWITYAACNGDISLEKIKKDMISELREAKLTFKIKDVADELMAAFADAELDDAE